MSDFKPSARTLILVLSSLLVVMLPAIWLTGMGYMWFVEHGLKLDATTRPEGVMDRLLVLAALLPMIPLMVMAIFMSGIPWMFVMSRVLSWEEIQHFTKQKGPRLPFLSGWLDYMWLRMIQSDHRRVHLEGLRSDYSAGLRTNPAASPPVPPRRPRPCLSSFSSLREP